MYDLNATVVPPPGTEMTGQNRGGKTKSGRVPLATFEVHISFGSSAPPPALYALIGLPWKTTTAPPCVGLVAPFTQSQSTDASALQSGPLAAHHSSRNLFLFELLGVAASGAPARVVESRGDDDDKGVAERMRRFSHALDITWQRVRVHHLLGTLATACDAGFSTLAPNLSFSELRTLRPCVDDTNVEGRLVREANASVLLRKFPDWTYHVALRTVLDQSFFSPVVLGLTVAGVTFCETWSRREAGDRLRDDWIFHIGKMWTVWGGGSIVSYLSVPTPWQPAFALGLAVGWSAFVSYRIHRPLVDLTSDDLVVEFLRQEQHWERGGG